MARFNSAHVAVFKKQKILLVQRRDVPLWVLPGGRLEKNESFEQAARRETFEESGFKVKLLKLIATYTDPQKKGQKKLFSGQIIGGKTTLNPEAQNISFFAQNKLPSPMLLFEKKRIMGAFNFTGSAKSYNFHENPTLEILNQLKNPVIFLTLLFKYITARS